jgi:hypothetical protein
MSAEALVPEMRLHSDRPDTASIKTKAFAFKNGRHAATSSGPKFENWFLVSALGAIARSCVAVIQATMTGDK